MEPTYADLPINDLVPHPDNPRRGNVKKIVESIKANGFYGTIVVQKDTMRILAGNHRWQAAKQCGMTHIPAMVVDVDETEARKILLADNRTADFAVYDADELSKLLKNVLAEDDLIGTGFDANDLDKLINEVTDTPDQKRKRNLEPFRHCYWLVKGTTTDQGAITDAITKALKKFPDIEIVSATN